MVFRDTNDTFEDNGKFGFKKISSHFIETLDPLYRLPKMAIDCPFNYFPFFYNLLVNYWVLPWHLFNPSEFSHVIPSQLTPKLWLRCHRNCHQANLKIMESFFIILLYIFPPPTLWV